MMLHKHNMRTNRVSICWRNYLNSFVRHNTISKFSVGKIMVIKF